MRSLAAFILLTVLGVIGFLAFHRLYGALPPTDPPQAQPAKYETLKAEAESFFSDGSYGRAHEIYLQADALDLPPTEARWVDFRLADTLWRSQAGTETADPTKYDQARERLEALIRDVQRAEDRDRVWVEAQESLGDFWWTRRDSRNWSQAWPHYQQALDGWAGSHDIEWARKRYLHIVWTMARPPWPEESYYYGSYGNWIPLETLENALKIAQTENDKAHLHYLLAMTLRQQGGPWDQRQRVPEEFEAALRPGRSTDWYDDALYQYAMWLATYGRTVALEDGQWRQEPDYVKAVQLFRRLVKEHRKGETRYYDEANQQIVAITQPVIGITVSNIFLPDSEIQFYLSWRNLKKVDLALYKVDLSQDVRFSDGNAGSSNWMQQIDLVGREKVKSWEKETGDEGDYKPGQEILHIDDKLPLGAYLLEARGGGLRARDLILVTDASLVLKASGKQALVYFCHALSGAPMAGARVQFWERSYNGQEWVWQESSTETNQEGLSVFDLRDTSSHREFFAGATLNHRQAFSTGYSYGSPREVRSWRIYAFTDRPAYRPGETVQWKLIARQYNGSAYETPSDQTLEFEINDPRGTKVKEGRATLNAFGSAWGSLELTQSMPLGEYRTTFWNAGRTTRLGEAILFRLEEYKLPEFKVSLQTPEVDGKKRTFRLGEKVEVSLRAEYYFGGPVANATVEALVYQNPFYPSWHPPRDFPWFYEDTALQRGDYGGGDGQIIKRETLKTDAMGQALLTFETPPNVQQDFEYRVEARVTDASRREIIGRDTVRVTRQRYYVYLWAEHTLYPPQDPVKVNVKALDANDRPVQAEGTVRVTRDDWVEIWLDPDGKEVKGAELKTLRERFAPFPPSPKDPGSGPWRLKFRGYQHEDILTQTVKTTGDGEAELTFKPEREGYYRIAWIGEDQKAPSVPPERPVRAETAVWVATHATTELGHRHGGLELIVDKETFRAGQKAPVMLTVPTGDRYVLFSVEGMDLYSYRLVHLTGTVKLVEVDVREEYVPNVFLSAAMVSDGQIFMDTRQVIVPPAQQFLEVTVEPDRPQYQPQEEGTLTVTVRDHEGKPVAAEVALGLVDESIYYLQQDYAGDPRPFYYGTKRPQLIQTQSTFQQKSYAKPVRDVEEPGSDERDRELRKSSEPRKEYNQLEAYAAGEKNRFDPAVRESADMAPSGALKAPAPQRLSPATEPAQTPDQEPAVQVRSDFRTTVFWQPDVLTDQDGQAIVKVKYPDSLTGWKAVARVATAGSRFGMASGSTRTKRPLIVRLQAPRFFVVGDTVTISAVINNNTDEAMAVTSSLDAEGILVEENPRPGGPTILKASGEARVDWVVSIRQPGQARLRVTARSDKYADAMEKSYPIYEHGIEKLITRSGKVRGDEATVKLDLPKERKPESTTLTVQVTPSLAVTMLEALPYLIDYPYGCTEQTMSRFLPAAIVAKTLKDLGLPPEAIAGKIWGGIVREHAGQTQPQGQRDLRQLDDLVKQGLDRLYDFQHADGGWGWWKDGESDHFMTGYVIWGLTLAREAGIAVRSDVLDRGVEYLDKEIVEEEARYDLQAWLLHALSAYQASMKQSGVEEFREKAFENLWANRERLNAYTRALLALSAHHLGYTDRAKTLAENLENGVKLDKTPDVTVLQRGKQESHGAVMGTAHWGEDRLYWRWSEGGVEATAFVLRALLAMDPKNKLVEPVTHWLLKNRRGAQWSNTRDTAIVVLALNDYLRQSDELNPELEYELHVNNHPIATQKITPEGALSAPSLFPIDRAYLQDGANEIRIVRKSGSSPLYFAAQAQFFTLEEPIPDTGHEIHVRRQYYRLMGRPTLLKGYIYDPQPLNDGEPVTSGERVEVVITIEAKNNYEYLVFEDLKPAGLEAVQIRSGEPLYAKELKAGTVHRKFSKDPGSADVPLPQKVGDPTDYTDRARWVYRELRDRKVALFIDKLPEGVWEIRYDLRAEAPGKFHALPVIGYAMYVPEIRTNGEEVRIRVEDSR